MLVFEKQVADNPTFYYRSTATTDREFESDISHFWAETLRRIRENREDGSWNRLIFECWCAQGFVLAFPQMRGESPHKKAPEIYVAISILDEIRGKLDNSDDPEEVRSLDALAYTKVRGAIRNTYRKEPAIAELKKTLEHNDFTCWTTKNDDLEKLMKFDVFFR